MSTFDGFLLVAMLALMVALFVALWRFIYGPTFVDRLITFDLMTANLVGIIGIYSMIAESPLLLDVALVFSLVAFFSIIPFALYMRKRQKHERNI